MQPTELYKFIIYIAKSVAILAIYLGLCFIFAKKIHKTIIRAILLGLITPLFFYHFTVNFIYPASYFLYITRIYDPNVAVLLFYVFVKPASIFSGIILAAILIVKDELN